MPVSTKALNTQLNLLHEEIKARAYHLLERKDTGTNGSNPDDELQGELPRIAYALSQVQERSDHETSDDRAYRAARIYLCALTSFVACRGRNPGATNGNPTE